MFETVYEVSGSPRKVRDVKHSSICQNVPKCMHSTIVYFTIFL